MNFNNLRLKWLIATKSLNYNISLIEQMYKIYLNHNKIIHYRDGYPVYSLATPAVFSKPAANMFARMFYKSVQNRNMPNLMSFAVNDICNASCDHCSFFTEVDNHKCSVLTLEQSKNLIKGAQELGVCVINFVGGEPLMRGDLLDIIKSVDKNLSTTTLFTNGWLLEEKANLLKKSGLDGVYVSIDSASSETHDKKRKKSGLFNKAIAGIRQSKKIGLSVGISCCITENDFKNGELEKIIELGKKLGVHEILVFDAIPTGKLRGCHSLIDNNEWIEDLIKFSEKYNKDLSYPGILIYAYATSHRSTGCSGGTSYFYVSPYGDISPCDFNHVIFGNILKTSLYKIWDKISSSDNFKQSTWGGCKMKDSNYINKDK